MFSIEILNAWAQQISYHSSPSPIPFWILGSYLLLPPAIFLFSLANTQLKFKFQTRYSFLFFPALLEMGIEFTTVFLRRSSQMQINLIDNVFWFSFTEILPLIGVVVVLYFYWNNIKAVTRQFKGSNNTHLFKLYGFFFYLCVLTLLWFLQSIIGWQVFPIIEMGLLIFLFLLSYIGYFNPNFFNVPQYLTNKTKAEFTQFDDSKELERLKLLFEREKVYTQPRLSLNELSKQLNLPSRYISKLIHVYHETDFRNFVNQYRVKEAINRIQDPKEQHKTLLAIGLESGFSSKSSFNQIFKTITGKKPSDYLKKAEN